MGRIRVNAPGGGYDILIEPGLLRRFPAVGEPPVFPHADAKIVIVTNITLGPLYGEALAKAHPDAALVALPDGEQYKTLASAARLYTDFVAAGLDRHGTVVALGGGVVGDVAGFAAATYLRGVRLVQMPTSLLAMVDSSVGGKVGVDLPQGKNLVGAFKQPDSVLIDPEVLKTLPDREWRCGLAEAIKHGLLADEGLLELIEAGRAAVQDAAELVQRAVQVKVDVVQADPFEQGVRAHLNLGHTFAHAVEQVSGYAWPHGEAVGVGLLAAAWLSCRMGLCSAALPERVERILAGVGLPTHLGELEPEAIYGAMGTDKKRQSGRLRFVLLRGIGQPVIVDDAPKETVLDVLRALQ
ncbi:MAG: 3-dehydroquinate synthase [Chloroflexi bacterium]|nr:3-dehydroquinate synthase [Chloroflexota bacterium]MDL1885226.1 3-dehydroquinate synthase [Anaerolineae bacterium CFX8]